MQYVTILLVGEGENVKRARERLNDPECFEVEWVPSAADALALLEKFLFDVAVVGGPMALLAEGILRIRDRAPNMPILALPRNEAAPDVAHRLQRIGAAQCLSPSISGSDFREALLASYG